MLSALSSKVIIKRSDICILPQLNTILLSCTCILHLEQDTKTEAFLGQELTERTAEGRDSQNFTLRPMWTDAKNKTECHKFTDTVITVFIILHQLDDLAAAVGGAGQGTR